MSTAISLDNQKQDSPLYNFFMKAASANPKNDYFEIFLGPNHTLKIEASTGCRLLSCAVQPNSKNPQIIPVMTAGSGIYVENSDELKACINDFRKIWLDLWNMPNRKQEEKSALVRFINGKLHIVLIERCSFFAGTFHDVLEKIHFADGRSRTLTTLKGRESNPSIIYICDTDLNYQKLNFLIDFENQWVYDQVRRLHLRLSASQEESLKKIQFEVGACDIVYNPHDQTFALKK